MMTLLGHYNHLESNDTRLNFLSGLKLDLKAMYQGYSFGDFFVQIVHQKET